MMLLKWFFWRRWKFKRLYVAFPEIDGSVVLRNAWRLNTSACRDNHLIWRDMRNIINGIVGKC